MDWKWHDGQLTRDLVVSVSWRSMSAILAPSVFVPIHVHLVLESFAYPFLYLHFRNPQVTWQKHFVSSPFYPSWCTHHFNIFIVTPFVFSLFVIVNFFALIWKESFYLSSRNPFKNIFVYKVYNHIIVNSLGIIRFDNNNYS